MTMIRSLFFWVFFGIFNTLFWILFGILLSLFLAGSKTIHFYCAVPWAKIILWGTGVKVEIRGLPSIDRQKTYIFVPNHLSFFDIFSLLAYLSVDFKFILKKELMRIPVLGWSIKRAGYISINRSSPAKARRTFERAVDRIKSGTSLVMFAEGTRGYDGHLQPLKRGAFQLAVASGVPVVPVAIKGTKEIMPKGSFTIRKGSIVIQLGEPIETISYTKQTMPDLIERVSGAITAMLEEQD
ncbi:MAG TPA: lysophospholipid acyltransferase family protein [Desulfatiglandales bacterium]|nr:lysophospholipid acyltransferase family protein [Desulfatiglandales bacterium]